METGLHCLFVCLFCFVFFVFVYLLSFTLSSFVKTFNSFKLGISFLVLHVLHKILGFTCQADSDFFHNIQGEYEKSITFWVIYNEKLSLYFGEMILWILL